MPASLYNCIVKVCWYLKYIFQVGVIDFSLYLKETQDSDGKQYVWWINNSKSLQFL